MLCVAFSPTTWLYEFCQTTTFENEATIVKKGIFDIKAENYSTEGIPLSQNEEKGPGAILEKGIQEQLHALSLSHLASEKKENQPNEALIQSQSTALKAVDSFLQSVFETEKKDYARRCQRKPWEDVIPLFYQGKDAAEEAKVKLANFSTLPQAIRLQEETLKFWEQALKQLRKPLKDEDLFCENQKSKTESKSASAQPAEGGTTQDVLRLLLLMNQEDQTLQGAPAEVQKGVKPW